jgi:hypothetical protein
MFIEMSRSDSESTDSDNNNEEPYSYDYYLQRIMPNAQYGDNVDLDDNSSLDFEILDDHSDVRFLILLISIFFLTLLKFRVKWNYLIHLMNQIICQIPHLIVQDIHLY